MQCVNSYQDIKTPEEEQEELEERILLESMLDEYDDEEADGCSYVQYKANCRRQIAQMKNNSREISDSKVISGYWNHD